MCDIRSSSVALAAGSQQSNRVTTWPVEISNTRIGILVESSFVLPFELRMKSEVASLNVQHKLTFQLWGKARETCFFLRLLQSEALLLKKVIKENSSDGTEGIQLPDSRKYLQQLLPTAHFHLKSKQKLHSPVL